MCMCVYVWRQGVGKHECNAYGDPHSGRDPQLWSYKAV